MYLWSFFIKTFFSSCVCKWCLSWKNIYLFLFFNPDQQFFFLSQWTPRAPPWAHPWSPTSWKCLTDQKWDSPPCPRRNTQPPAAAWTRSTYPAEPHPPTRTTSAGVTSGRAAPPGGPYSTPAADRWRNITCTPKTSARQHQVTATRSTRPARWPGPSLRWICQNQT